MCVWWNLSLVKEVCALCVWTGPKKEINFLHPYISVQDPQVPTASNMLRKQTARSPTREEREEVLRDLNETDRTEYLEALKAEEAVHPKQLAEKPRKRAKAAPRSPSPLRLPSPSRSPSYSPPPPRSLFAKREEYVEAYDMWNRLNPGHRETPDEEK